MIAIEDLKEWAMTYFKNRDIMLRRIDKIEEVDDSFIIHNIDSTTNQVKIMPGFEDSLFSTFQGKTTTLVILNSRENIDFLIANWQKFTQMKELTLMFANPDSLAEKKWIVNPYIHNKITEPKSLRAGLISLFTTVDPVIKKG